MRRFRRCTSGSVAALFAIVSPVLVGAMGLGAETGYWYLQKRNVQNAADVGAHAAALRKVSGDDVFGYSGMASYIVERTGLDMARTSTSVVSPPQTGEPLFAPPLPLFGPCRQLLEKGSRIADHSDLRAAVLASKRRPRRRRDGPNATPRRAPSCRRPRPGRC